MASRLTQEVPEVVLDGTPNIRVTQVLPEIVMSGGAVARIRLSQITVELLVDVVHTKPIISFVAA